MQNDQAHNLRLGCQSVLDREPPSISPSQFVEKPSLRQDEKVPLQLKAVVFDVFGTLVRIKKGHQPYLKLLRATQRLGRRPLATDARSILTFDGSIAAYADSLNCNLSDEEWELINAALAADLAQIEPFAETYDVITQLKNQGIKVGVCSNLAAPYGAVVQRLLPGLDAYVMSYEVGFIKPEPEIYANVITQLNIPAADCLFVGDSYDADVVGPRVFGMAARRIDRSAEGNTLWSTLADILPCNTANTRFDQVSQVERAMQSSMDKMAVLEKAAFNVCHWFRLPPESLFPKNDEMLSETRSGYYVLLIGIQQMLCKMLGDEQQAHLDWLYSHNLSLGAVPVELLKQGQFQVVHNYLEQAFVAMQK